MTKELTPETFNTTINQSTLTLVQFTAEWCGPCKAMAPIIHQLGEDNPDVTILKIDIDDYPELAQQYKIKGVPTFLLFKEGNILDSKVGGSQKKEFQNLLNKFTV